MRTKTALVAGAALGVFVASGFAADAKTAHRHHVRHAARGPSEVAELREEVDLLKAKVESLEGRLEDNGAPQAQLQAMQTQVQAAQSQAQNAEAIAQANQAKIDTLPTEVATEVKKATPKPGWAADTTLGATIFADASNIRYKNDGGIRQPPSGTNFDIKRLYLSVDHKFNNVFSANATTDFIYDGGSGATQLIIKKAWLQAKLSDALIIRAGASDLPWVPFVEKLYGNRYVEQVMIDRTKFGTSTDWGLHAFGSLGGGILGYQVSVVDGSGYKVPAIGTANRTDHLDVEGRVNVTYAHFTAAIGGYDGKLGKAVAGGVLAPNSAQRIDALLAYTSDRFRIGGEYFWAKDWNDVTQLNPLKVNKSDGYSVFGSFNFTKKISVFGRYDYVKPQKTTAPSFTDNYFNVGVSYSPIKPLDFALVYKRDQVENGLFNTGNGKIGTTNASGIGKGYYDEIGLFTQVKF